MIRARVGRDEQVPWTRAAEAIGGRSLRLALGDWAHPTGDLTPADLMRWLSHGATVMVGCTQARPTKGGSGHRLRLEPDGSVEPIEDYCAGLAATGADLTMQALGDRPSTCLEVARHLAARTIIPAPPRDDRPLRARFGRLDLPLQHKYAPAPTVRPMVAKSRSLNRHLRAVHAAIVWAHHDLRHGPTWADLPPSTVGRLLDAGVTPAVQSTWARHGWVPRVAFPFQAAFVPLDLANQWRAAGQTDRAAALAAAEGAIPVGDPYIEAGLPRRFQPLWMSHNVHPATAATWQRLGFTPRAHMRSLAHETTCLEAFDPGRWRAHGLPPDDLAPMLDHAARHDVAVVITLLSAGLTVRAATYVCRALHTRRFDTPLSEAVTEFLGRRGSIHGLNDSDEDEIFDEVRRFSDTVLRYRLGPGETQPGWMAT